MKDGSFYTGITSAPDVRLRFHNSKRLNKGVTKRKMPWEYYLILRVNRKYTALRIERHIKRMKSRIYIQNLKKYPEMVENLIKKYS